LEQSRGSFPLPGSKFNNMKNKTFWCLLVIAALVLAALYIKSNGDDYAERMHNIEFHSEIKDTVN
jgi:hypothetical protein